MENKLSLDIGEEIISKFKELIERLNKILDLRDEKELQNQFMVRN